MAVSSDSNPTRASIFIRLNDAKLREVSWQEFYDRYGPMIHGSARRLGATAAEADDVVQDVLMGFFAASGKFKYEPSKGSFKGFLKVCALRALRKQIRKGRVDGKRPKEIGEADMPTDQIWEDVWEKELLRQSFERVRSRYKNNSTFQAFARIVVNGETVDEVCSALGMSKENVYKAKQRIAVAVREELEILAP